MLLFLINRLTFIFNFQNSQGLREGPGVRQGPGAGCVRRVRQSNLLVGCDHSDRSDRQQQYGHNIITQREQGFYLQPGHESVW